MEARVLVAPVLFVFDLLLPPPQPEKPRQQNRIKLTIVPNFFMDGPLLDTHRCISLRSRRALKNRHSGNEMGRTTSAKARHHLNCPVKSCGRPILLFRGRTSTPSEGDHVRTVSFRNVYSVWRTLA